MKTEEMTILLDTNTHSPPTAEKQTHNVTSGRKTTGKSFFFSPVGGSFQSLCDDYVASETEITTRFLKNDKQFYSFKL